MQIKSTERVRKVIVEEIALLRKGESNPARANAISNLIGKLLNSVKLDIDVHRYVSKSKVKNLSIPLIDQEEDKQSRGAKEKKGKEE